jgi:hypothetical protein
MKCVPRVVDSALWIVETDRLSLFPVESRYNATVLRIVFARRHYACPELCGVILRDGGCMALPVACIS